MALFIIMTGGKGEKKNHDILQSYNNWKVNLFQTRAPCRPGEFSFDSNTPHTTPTTVRYEQSIDGNQ